MTESMGDRGSETGTEESGNKLNEYTTASTELAIP